MIKEKRTTEPQIVKPWYGLEAMARRAGLDGHKIMYRPKDIRNLKSPQLVTTFCLPGGSFWDGEKIDRKIRPEMGFRMVDERLSSIDWLTKQFGTKLIIYLCDDDFKYCFEEGYDSGTIDALVIGLGQQLANLTPAGVEIKKVTDLAEMVGIDYVGIQQQIFNSVNQVKAGGRSAWSQAKGWLRAVINTAENKIQKIEQKYSVSLPSVERDKVYKPLIGVAIQGMALRILYYGQESLYLATIPNNPDEFWELDIKVMMGSELNGIGFVPGLPAIFCPEMVEGNLDLEAAKSAVVREMNPVPGQKDQKPSFSYRKVSSLKSGKACDDL